ncbi:hypothetical protein JC606_04645 [Vibrio sp. IB15]|uniref:hypothetical protein n=1 Tax=Vibrio sp. IB15 TaxID=2779368 RepID=UPI0018E8556C|nr:hypothetical protein [Vibrio sp. IB15]MBJ2145666.1 hypothetical protein [Vibrio sp. IB15]
MLVNTFDQNIQYKLIYAPSNKILVLEQAAHYQKPKLTFIVTSTVRLEPIGTHLNVKGR